MVGLVVFRLGERSDRGIALDLGGCNIEIEFNGYPVGNFLYGIKWRDVSSELVRDSIGSVDSYIEERVRDIREYMDNEERCFNLLKGIYRVRMGSSTHHTSIDGLVREFLDRSYASVEMDGSFDEYLDEMLSLVNDDLSKGTSDEISFSSIFGGLVSYLDDTMPVSVYGSVMDSEAYYETRSELTEVGLVELSRGSESFKYMLYRSGRGLGFRDVSTIVELSRGSESDGEDLDDRG